MTNSGKRDGFSVIVISTVSSVKTYVPLTPLTVMVPSFSSPTKEPFYFTTSFFTFSRVFCESVGFFTLNENDT